MDNDGYDTIAMEDSVALEIPPGSLETICCQYEQVIRLTDLGVVEDLIAEAALPSPSSLEAMADIYTIPTGKLRDVVDITPLMLPDHMG